MEGIDRSKIDAIILRESGNSLFMQQQLRRDEKVNQRIQQLQSKLETNSDPRVLKSTPELELQLQLYQAQQPNRSTKVVVDMDMFYMACELLSKPQLAKVPSCVGGGMILTSNYKARRYGVRSAMAGFVGDKLVEELSQGQERLVHVKSNYQLYKEKSKQVIQVLKEYDPNLKSYSLDEAYLELGPYLAHYLKIPQQPQEGRHESIRAALLRGDDSQSPHDTTNPTPTEANFAYNFINKLHSFSPEACQQAVTEVVHGMRARVTLATGGLTCSAGIAPNFGLAKIGSDQNKPNGQLFVNPFAIQDFVHPLPVRKIPGIGRVTEKVLQHVCQVTNVQELYQQRGLIQWLFQPATATYLLKASVGCLGSSTSGFPSDNDDEESSSTEQKGISRERTFSPEKDWNQLLNRLDGITKMLSEDMAKKEVMAHTVTIKVKLKTFDVWSRAKSLDRDVYIHAPEELFAVARELLLQVKAEISTKQEFCCRLLGIRCSSLLHASSLAQQKPMDKFLTKPNATKILEMEGSNWENDVNQGRMEQPSTATVAKRDGGLLVHEGAVENRSKENDFSGERNLCPLCNLEIVGDNETLNRHVDTCLNSSAVRHLVKEVASMPPANKKTSHRLTDFW